MTYDKFLAYQLSIPDFSKDDDDDQEEGKEIPVKTKNKSKKNEPQGYINLFDLGVNGGKIK
jgi:hypothetical protein